MRLQTAQLGAGDVVELDYDLRVDIRQGLPGVNLIADVRDLSAIPDHSLALIKASHLIEHFEGYEQVVLLKEWRRVLAPGGILLLWTPDFGWASEQLSLGKLEQSAFDLILQGKRDHAWNAHKHLWDKTEGTNILAGAGFEILEMFTDAGSLVVYARAE